MRFSFGADAENLYPTTPATRPKSKMSILPVDHGPPLLLPQATEDSRHGRPFGGAIRTYKRNSTLSRQNDFIKHTTLKRQKVRYCN